MAGGWGRLTCYTQIFAILKFAFSICLLGHKMRSHQLDAWEGTPHLLDNARSLAFCNRVNINWVCTVFVLANSSFYLLCSASGSVDIYRFWFVHLHLTQLKREITFTSISSTYTFLLGCYRAKSRVFCQIFWAQIMLVLIFLFSQLWSSCWVTRPNFVTRLRTKDTAQ